MHKTVTSVSGQGASWLEVVREQVDSLRFGQVQIVVHNSQVVQVERTERIRFDRPSPEPETQSPE